MLKLLPTRYPHIARSTATNRGVGALHLGAEVSMHCAISMWIPPLHRTMAHMRRARKRPRRRPPGAPCNPRGGAGWVRVRFYDKAGASKRPKRAQHQKLLCMFKMSIRRPQNRTQRGQKPPQPPPTTLGPPESPPRGLEGPVVAYMQQQFVRDSWGGHKIGRYCGRTAGALLGAECRVPQAAV